MGPTRVLRRTQRKQELRPPSGHERLRRTSTRGLSPNHLGRTGHVDTIPRVEEARPRLGLSRVPGWADSVGAGAVVNLLAIDPGVHECACAYFRDGALT